MVTVGQDTFAAVLTLAMWPSRLWANLKRWRKKKEKKKEPAVDVQAAKPDRSNCICYIRPIQLKSWLLTNKYASKYTNVCVLVFTNTNCRPLLRLEISILQDRSDGFVSEEYSQIYLGFRIRGIIQQISMKMPLTDPRLVLLECIFLRNTVSENFHITLLHIRANLKRGKNIFISTRAKV